MINNQQENPVILFFIPLCACAGVGGTKAPFVDFSVSNNFDLAKIPVKFF